MSPTAEPLALAGNLMRARRTLSKVEPLVSIQMLRAMAAMGVVLAHVWQVLSILGLQKSFPNFVEGTAGVDLFFVISGFIMVYVSEPLFGRNSAPAIFFVRRLIRIVPLYWMCTTVYLAFLLLAHHGMKADDLSWISIISSYLFLPLPRPSGDLSPVLMVGWTLNYEMLFYSVFAVATLLSRDLAIFAVTLFFFFAVGLGAAVGLQSLPAPLSMWCSAIVLEFVFGMWIALAMRYGLRLPWQFSLIAIVAGAVLIFAQSEVGTLAHVCSWAAGAALIVGGIVLSNGKLPDAFWVRPLAFLGDASYSLYLVHIIAMAALTQIAVRLMRFVSLDQYVWSFAALLVLASVAGAIIVHVFVERPMTAFLRKKLS